MYVDHKRFEIQMDTDGEGRYFCAGIGVGVVSEASARSTDAYAGGAVTLPHIPTQHNSTQLGAPKQKPFVIIDGVVYINAALIKENTL